MCVHVCVSYDQREVFSREEEILHKTVEREDDGTLLHESRGRAICEERDWPERASGWSARGGEQVRTEYQVICVKCIPNPNTNANFKNCW